VAQNRWCLERLGGKSELSRADLERAFVEYVDQRIGIKARHVIDREAILDGRPSESGRYASDLGARASERALAAAGVAAADVELIVCGTSSPDRLYPTTAIEIQDKLGATRAQAWDLLAACSSFAYALHVARGLVSAGIHRRILVVTAEYFSAGVNYADPNNAFFWGDAAAATVVERADLARGRESFWVRDTHCLSIPSQAIRTGVGGTKPFLAGASRLSGRADGDIMLGAPDDPYFYQDGRKVYRDVVPAVAAETAEFIRRNDLSVAQIRRFWFHQPSSLFLDAIVKRLLKEGADRVAVSLEEYGNTSSCGAALCLAQDDATRPGDLGIVSVFGAGYTIGLGLLQHVGA
jgi:beta-ketodecanoyl-[acyl-carrier-protein] synthase